jgi:hypothetical protein
VQFLLPPNRQAQNIRLDGHEIKATQRRVEESLYLVLPAIQQGVHHVEVDLS